jgi:dCTP deaminase
MAILSGAAIEALGIISPIAKKQSLNWDLNEGGRVTLSGGLGSCGYDIHLAEHQTAMLHHGGFLLVSAKEKFKMPLNVAARVHDKSTLARLGLAVQNTFIEPGWRGYLTLELTNHSQSTLRICSGMPIAQIVFEEVEGPVRGYRGKYQDQPNQPVEAR